MGRSTRYGHSDRGLEGDPVLNPAHLCGWRLRAQCSSRIPSLVVVTAPTLSTRIIIPTHLYQSNSGLDKLQPGLRIVQGELQSLCQSRVFHITNSI